MVTSEYVEDNFRVKQQTIKIAYIVDCIIWRGTSFFRLCIQDHLTFYLPRSALQTSVCRWIGKQEQDSETFTKQETKHKPQSHVTLILNRADDVTPSQILNRYCTKLWCFLYLADCQSNKDENLMITRYIYIFNAIIFIKIKT